MGGYMAEQDDNLVAADFGKKLKSILDDVLATGDWESSVFLKASAAKIQGFRAEVEELCFSSGEGIKTENVDKDEHKKNIPPGYTRVFILLYQVDGSNLQGWHRTIKNLEEYNVTRPVYKDENHAKEFIRSKSSNIERNGYVIANVKDDFVFQTDTMDTFGHQLFALREKAIQLENVFEFVHANKRCYAVRNDDLILLGDI